MVIDCERCEVRGLACGDCVVGVLLGMPGWRPGHGGRRTGSRRPDEPVGDRPARPRCISTHRSSGRSPCSRIRASSRGCGWCPDPAAAGEQKRARARERPVTRGEITPFRADLSVFVHPAEALRCRAVRRGSTRRPALAPLRNLRETSRTASRPPRTAPSRSSSVTRAARGRVGRRTRRKESRQRGPAPALPVVPAALGVLRPPPAAPLLGGAPPRCSWPSSP